MDLHGQNQFDLSLGGADMGATHPAISSAVYKELNPDIGLPDQVRSLLEENRRLKEELETRRADMARLERLEREVMALVNAKSREKVIHELRNVLNELVLLRAIASQDDLR
jgi:hypothetical protein